MNTCTILNNEEKAKVLETLINDYNLGEDEISKDFTVITDGNLYMAIVDFDKDLHSFYYLELPHNYSDVTEYIKDELRFEYDEDTATSDEKEDYTSYKSLMAFYKELKANR